MRKGGCTLNQAGFTLIELISVMVIIGVMASVGVKKMDIISDTATDRVMLEAVKELNSIFSARPHPSRDTQNDLISINICNYPRSNIFLPNIRSS